MPLRLKDTDGAVPETVVAVILSVDEVPCSMLRDALAADTETLNGLITLRVSGVDPDVPPPVPLTFRLYTPAATVLATVRFKVLVQVGGIQPLPFRFVGSLSGSVELIQVNISNHERFIVLGIPWAARERLA